MIPLRLKQQTTTNEAVRHTATPRQNTVSMDQPVIERNHGPRNVHNTKKISKPHKPAIRLRQLNVEPRYDPWLHHNDMGAARFFARQQQERLMNNNDNKQQLERIVAFSIRRQSQLAVFLVALFQFITFDTYWILPSGLIIYALSFQIALEQWMLELEEQDRLKLQEDGVEQEIQDAVQKARFEFHVLRNRPDVEIFPIRRPADGAIVVYAVAAAH
jgi:hypothetical protein